MEIIEPPRPGQGSWGGGYPNQPSGYPNQTIVVVRGLAPGVLSGVLACLFGVLGVFTIGIVFVPLAAVFSVVGLARGLFGLSGAGVAVSAVGALLTVLGFVASPSLWLIAAGLIYASH